MGEKLKKNPKYNYSQTNLLHYQQPALLKKKYFFIIIFYNYVFDNSQLTRPKANECVVYKLYIILYKFRENVCELLILFCDHGGKFKKEKEELTVS